MELINPPLRIKCSIHVKHLELWDIVAAYKIVLVLFFDQGLYFQFLNYHIREISIILIFLNHFDILQYHKTFLI